MRISRDKALGILRGWAKKKTGEDDMLHQLLINNQDAIILNKEEAFDGKEQLHTARMNAIELARAIRVLIGKNIYVEEDYQVTSIRKEAKRLNVHIRRVYGAIKEKFGKKSLYKLTGEERHGTFAIIRRFAKQDKQKAVLV